MIRSHSRLVLKNAALLAPVLAGLFVGGCATDQKKEIATYRKVLDGKRPPALDYQEGQPLTLEAALLLANRNDEQLASSGEDYLQALIDKERQFSAFLPTIGLAPIYTWVNNKPTNASLQNVQVAAGQSQVVYIPGSGVQQGQFDLPVSGNYNVFNGFQDISNLRRAGYTSEQRKALLLDLQQTILLNVAQAYYTVLSNERSVTVLLNSADVQNARVADMEGRERAGIARPLDVAQTEAQAAATRVELIQSQNNVRNGRIALAFLTSAPVQDAPLADRLSVPAALPSADDALKDAEKVRQDVQASEAAVESARQGVQAAIGQYYPSISLNLQYFLHRDTASALTLWEGMVNANVPIFTAGIVDANVRTAWSQLRQAWLNEQRTRRQVAEQVRTAYENLKGSKRRLVELRVEVSAARDALQQAQFSYQAGLATNLDVLTATDQLLSAQLSLVTEELNFKVYYLQLLRSEGRLPRPDSALPAASAPTSQPSEEELTTPAFNGTPAPTTAPVPTTSPAPATAPAPAPTTAPGNATAPAIQ